jgi:hypothetical protein
LPLSWPSAQAPSGDPVEVWPAAEAADASWRFTPSPVLRGVRALVVEDDAASREVIQYLLQQCEAEVTAVDNASDAPAGIRKPAPVWARLRHRAQ